MVEFVLKDGTSLGRHQWTEPPFMARFSIPTTQVPALREQAPQVLRAGHGPPSRFLSDHDLPWGTDTLPADERVPLQIDLRRALRGLPERLVALCQRLAQATVAEIARETGVSRTSLYGELGEVRTAFHAAGLDDYLRPPPTDFPRFR